MTTIVNLSTSVCTRCPPAPLGRPGDLNRRGHETPGEDPYLTAQYVAHFVSGLQGHPSDSLYDSRFLKSIATCKHWDA